MRFGDGCAVGRSAEAWGQASLPCGSCAAEFNADTAGDFEMLRIAGFAFRIGGALLRVASLRLGSPSLGAQSLWDWMMGGRPFCADFTESMNETAAG